MGSRKAVPSEEGRVQPFLVPSCRGCSMLLILEQLTVLAMALGPLMGWLGVKQAWKQWEVRH